MDANAMLDRLEELAQPARGKPSPELVACLADLRAEVERALAVAYRRGQVEAYRHTARRLNNNQASQLAHLARADAMRAQVEIDGLEGRR